MGSATLKIDTVTIRILELDIYEEVPQVFEVFKGEDPPFIVTIRNYRTQPASVTGISMVYRQK